MASDKALICGLGGNAKTTVTNEMSAMSIIYQNQAIAHYQQFQFIIYNWVTTIVCYLLVIICCIC